MSPEDEEWVADFVAKYVELAIDRYEDMLRDVVVKTLRDAMKRDGSVRGVRTEG